MDPRDVKTLLLLEAIDTDEYQSQRELSMKLNISLGLVNTFIKRLTARGVFKATKLPKNRIGYNLSPKGIVEKAELTKEYYKYTIQYYRKIKKRIAKLLTRLENNGYRKIVFYGAYEVTEIACVISGEINIETVTVIDERKEGSKICGFEIQNEAALKILYYDAIIIMDLDNGNSSRNHLLDMGVPTEKIILDFIAAAY